MSVLAFSGCWVLSAEVRESGLPLWRCWCQDSVSFADVSGPTSEGFGISLDPTTTMTIVDGKEEA